MGYTFISGATGGIGKAFARVCAKRGDNLFLTGRSNDKLNDLKKEIEKNYEVKVLIYSCELTSIESRKSLLNEIDNLKLGIDRIVNVAGIDIQKPFVDYTEDKVVNQIRVNSEATIVLTHELIKRRGKALEIVTISSMSGVSPMPYFALYSATKAMLTNFFTSLHYELKKEGIKVTTVLPGGVYTRPDIVEQIKRQGIWGKISAKTPEFIAEKSLKAVKKNKIKYIPGGFNKFLHFIMNVAPKRIVLSFIARRWKRESKDAF